MKTIRAWSILSILLVASLNISAALAAGPATSEVKAPEALCSGEMPAVTPPFFASSGKAESFLGLVNSCGEVCLASCEAYCGVGSGRCNPRALCACECW